MYSILYHVVYYGKSLFIRVKLTATYVYLDWELLHLTAVLKADATFGYDLWPILASYGGWFAVFFILQVGVGDHLFADCMILLQWEESNL